MIRAALSIDQERQAHYRSWLMISKSALVRAVTTILLLSVIGAFATTVVLLGGVVQGAAEEARLALPLPRAGNSLVGTPVKDWLLEGWLDRKERTVQSLRGKVVLIRFWTATCPFCAASLPALSALYQQKRSEGLEVIGLHHPKPFGSAPSAAALKQVLLDWKVDIPVGLDTQWQTLKTYWLDEHSRSATSATLLLDRRGVIRWVHPGVEYHPDRGQAGHEQCVQDWQDLVRAVETLLQEAP